MEILFLIALIILNGAFAMSEIALVTARRARLARLAEDGDGAAVVAIELHDEPTRFLSTIQIGITSIGILNGIVGEAVLAEPFARWMHRLGLEQETSSIAATAAASPSSMYFCNLALRAVASAISDMANAPLSTIRTSSRAISMMTHAHFACGC